MTSAGNSLFVQTEEFRLTASTIDAGGEGKRKPRQSTKTGKTLKHDNEKKANVIIVKKYSNQINFSNYQGCCLVVIR